MLRLFVAADTPKEILPLLAAARDRLRAVRSDVKWEPDDKLHCTLKFLGDTRETLVQPVADALATIARAASPVPLVYAGVGRFPPKGDPRVIWAGITDTEGRLGALAESVDTRLAEFGFEREERRFHPHVTLGRVKGHSGIRELLATAETLTLDCPPVSLRTIALIKSDLKPGGSVYTPLAVFTLGAEG